MINHKIITSIYIKITIIKLFFINHLVEIKILYSNNINISINNYKNDDLSTDLL